MEDSGSSSHGGLQPGFYLSFPGTNQNSEMGNLTVSLYRVGLSTLPPVTDVISPQVLRT
jgi:hypothetical protein